MDAIEAPAEQIVLDSLLVGSHPTTRSDHLYQRILVYNPIKIKESHCHPVQQFFTLIQFLLQHSVNPRFESLLQILCNGIIRMAQILRQPDFKYFHIVQRKLVEQERRLIWFIIRSLHDLLEKSQFIHRLEFQHM